jgi:hypothetical protein
MLANDATSEKNKNKITGGSLFLLTIFFLNYFATLNLKPLFSG